MKDLELVDLALSIMESEDVEPLPKETGGIDPSVSNPLFSTPNQVDITKVVITEEDANSILTQILGEDCGTMVGNIGTVGAGLGFKKPKKRKKSYPKIAEALSGASRAYKKAYRGQQIDMARGNNKNYWKKSDTMSQLRSTVPQHRKDRYKNSPLSISKNRWDKGVNRIKKLLQKEESIFKGIF